MKDQTSVRPVNTGLLGHLAPPLILLPVWEKHLYQPAHCIRRNNIYHPPCHVCSNNISILAFLPWALTHNLPPSMITDKVSPPRMMRGLFIPGLFWNRWQWIFPVLLCKSADCFSADWWPEHHQNKSSLSPWIFYCRIVHRPEYIEGEFQENCHQIVLITIGPHLVLLDIWDLLVVPWDNLFWERLLISIVCFP